MSNTGFIKLTDADTEEKILVLLGNGGAIKAVSFGDGTTELYNSEGDMVAKVKENVDQLYREV